MPKVSVVVPVFNVHKYLGECLDSILQQTLTDIEVLCGDGGSTDGSLEILEEYAKKDKRITVISKNGSGYGESVNDCMDIAQGEYIGIVESDDAVKNNTYEVMYDLAVKNDLDWIRGDIFYYYTDSKEGKKLERESIIYGGDFYCQVLNPQKDYRPYKSGVRTWSGIYKKEFLDKNNIRHNETPGGSYQDVGFYLKTLYYAQRVYFVDQAFYMWRQDNPGSSINYNSSKLVQKSLDEWRLNREYLDSHPQLGKRAVASYHYRKFFSYLWTIDLADQGDKKRVKEVALKEFTKALQENEIDPGFFETWEWERFKSTLQEWQESDSKNNSVLKDKKKRLKKVRGILHPFAYFLQKITSKLMAIVLYHIDFSIGILQKRVNETADDTQWQVRESEKEIKDSICVLQEAVYGLSKNVDSMSDIFAQKLGDMELKQEITVQSMEGIIQKINICMENITNRINVQMEKTLDQGDVLWSVRDRVEDINRQTEISAQKILDQGELIWRAKDRLEDIYSFERYQADAQAWNMLYEIKHEKIEQVLSQSPLYDISFYLNNRYGSVRSAQQILYVLFERERHDSVVDFGCGTGTWLWVAGMLGSKEILGIDGNYLPQHLLMIAKENFFAHDLSLPIHLHKKFDIAISMETAEHLPESAADTFVESICSSSDTVIFSAAHPGQGGDGHINEQNQEYWISKFANFHFNAFSVAELFANNSKIEKWYRDNIIMFKKGIQEKKR